MCLGMAESLLAVVAHHTHSSRCVMAVRFDFKWDAVLLWSAQLHGQQCDRCTYSIVNGREVAAQASRCTGVRDPLKYALQQGTIGERSFSRSGFGTSVTHACLNKFACLRVWTGCQQCSSSRSACLDRAATAEAHSELVAQRQRCFQHESAAVPGPGYQWSRVQGVAEPCRAGGPSKASVLYPWDAEW